MGAGKVDPYVEHALGYSAEVWLDQALRDKMDLRVYAFGHLLVRSASPLRVVVAPLNVSVADNATSNTVFVSNSGFNCCYDMTAALVPSLSSASSRASVGFGRLLDGRCQGGSGSKPAHPLVKSLEGAAKGVSGCQVEGMCCVA